MRKNGILLHISSLPSEYGIGKMGKHAFEFVDFLVRSGVKLWQILPLSPTSYGDSPYQSFSVNAGNPYFIDFEILEGDGLLEAEDYKNIVWDTETDKVDYALIYDKCFDVLRIAYSRFKASKFPAYKKFCDKNKNWLDEYALFMALKFENDGKAWYEWGKDISMHRKKAVAEAKKRLKKEIGFFKFLQFEFSRQWSELKKYANENGIEIVGDIPIYCAYDSVEVWSDHKLLCLTQNAAPLALQAVPPMNFRLWDSFGEIPCTTGIITELPILNGGLTAWLRQRSFTTLSALTISVDLKAFMPFPTAKRTQLRASG
jgi:4-alpha-glucanotransferase